MSSEQQDNTSKYRVEYVAPKSSKLRFSGESLRNLDQESPLVATVKVSQKAYIPSGVEVRTQITPFIFTANIPFKVLEDLEQDPAVIVIEPGDNLHSY